MTRDENGRFVKGHEGMGGRKPKSHEEKVLAAVNRACSPSDIQAIMESLIRKALNGNIQAAKVVLAYAIGMPIQKTDITTGGKEITLTVVYDKSGISNTSANAALEATKIHQQSSETQDNSGG